MDHAQLTFVERMGHAAESDGLSPIGARLFALLLLSEQPRSLDALADELAVSKASVSTEARHLLERGIVARVSHAGDRRDYYEIAPNFYAEIIRHRIARWRRLQTLVTTVRETSAGLSPAVHQRLASVDEIQAAVINGIDERLGAWEAGAHKRPAKRAAPKQRALRHDESEKSHANRVKQ